VPAPEEQEFCAFWSDWELRLKRPRLVVPVGGLAIRRLLGRKQLAGTIGERFPLADDRVAIPLPHPSGVSLWLNSPDNRALVTRAVALIHEELAAIDARPSASDGSRP
jgi:uracil-DNA glycosylase